MRLYRKQSVRSALNPMEAFRAAVSYKAMILQLTRRNIEIQHRGSVFGAAWSVLNPLLIFAVYVFVFLVVFDGRFGEAAGETRLDYALGVLLGLSMTQFLIEIIGGAPLLIVHNPNYVKKVVFPIGILPLSLSLAAFFRAIVGILLVTIAALLTRQGLPLTAVLLPTLLLPLYMLGLAAAFLFSSLGVYFRDLAQIAAFFSILLTFFSGVFYSTDRLPNAFHFLRANPLVLALENSRKTLLWGQCPDVWSFGYIYGFAIVTLLVAYGFFHVTRPTFGELV